MIGRFVFILDTGSHKCTGEISVRNAGQTSYSAMVRKKRKGVMKEAHATGAVVPNGVDLRLIMSQVPSNVALPAALGDSDLAAWYDTLCAAHGSLYEQLKMLQLFRAKLKGLATEEMSNIILLIWQLIFRLSEAPISYPLRKNFGLILNVLEQSEGPVSSELRIVAAQELRAYLTTLWHESDVPHPTTEQRVTLLDRMLHLVESPYLARLLVENPVLYDGTSGEMEHLLQFITCCGDQLEALEAPIMAYQKTTLEAQNEPENEAVTVSTNGIVAASERCGHALKSIIIVTTMKEVLDRRLQQCCETSVTMVTTTLLRIVKHCVLLLQTHVVHKDLLTQAGLAYCLLLRILLELTARSSYDATQLLLQAAYLEMRSISSACLNDYVQRHVETDMASFGGLSRLAVYRGLLTSLTNESIAVPAENFGINVNSSSKTSVLNTILSKVQQYCEHESHTTRLFAFQVLEAILRRAVLILQTKALEYAQDLPLISVSTLTTITTSVLLNWEHPSKKLNQFMATVFAYIVDYQVLSSGFKDWSNVLLPRVVELPPTSRAKYGSLALLVDQAGAQQVLQACPALLSTLLAAVGQKDYAAPAAANLFAQILDNLAQHQRNQRDKLTSSITDNDSVAAWRHLWLSDVIQVLFSPDANLRARVAMYVIPLLLKKDSACVPILLQRLRNQATNASDRDIALWAELEVLKLARKKMAPEKLLDVSAHAIELGLCHADGKIRATAFDALCASLKSTSLPTDKELQLIKGYLVINGKEIDPAGRMNTLIGLKTVLIRINETIRLARKNQTTSVIPYNRSNSRNELETAKSFQHWVELFIVASIYPGALPQRITLGLELFLLYVQLFGLMRQTTESSFPSLLYTKHTVTTLFHMLTSAWDSIRSLSFTILDLFPDDLPGYATRQELSNLLTWTIGLCGSPRQRESDAGAIFIRLLFQKCRVAIHRFQLSFQPSFELQNGALKTRSANPDIAFVLQLTDMILYRIKALNPVELQQGASPLVHGFLLALHYILDNLAFDPLTTNDASDWPHAIAQVFHAVHESMRVSLAVVGDATCGVGDQELSASFAGVVGEVSTVAKTTSSALRVDCRGHLIVETSDYALNGASEDDNTEQRAVVSSWLAAREGGAILKLLMNRVPLPTSASRTDHVSYLTVEMAQQGGEILLNALFELKHKGAVAMAYQAFEGVCAAFLAHSEHHPMLSGLPSYWAERLLERLERSEQHFILRRSSGFAFSFVAILRAEPRNAAAVILPKVMATLLRLAGEDTDAAEKDSLHDHHSLWRARVHALNILKLICQDGVLADDVAQYVVAMFELAVQGFECGSWAVRNSSMMLFAAATQRAIGDKRIADGNSHQLVASTDVFSRFQKLRSVLGRELTRMLANESKSTSALGGASPPGLYPLLLFLSRLRPGDEEDQRKTDAGASFKSNGTGLATFVPLVLQCASQPTMAIQFMASKALASIVKDTDAASVVLLLFAKLPRGIGRAKDSVAISHNTVHGILTQIRHLATKHLARNSPSTVRPTSVQVDFFQVIASQVLPSIMWLWAGPDAVRINVVIRAEVVAIIDVIMHFYAYDVSSVHDMLLTDAARKAFVQTTEDIQAEVERQLLQRCALHRAAALVLSTRPGMYALDRSLVSTWFCLWTASTSINLFNGVVKEFLVSNVLQIRKKAIKQFAHKLTVTDLTQEQNVELQIFLIHRFQTETHPKIRARLLQLLEQCPLDQASLKTQTQLQTELVRTLNISADPRILAPALKLLALVVVNSTRKLSTPDNKALCQTLCQEIELRSHESQSLLLREAAASALDRSGLLVMHKAQEDSAEVVFNGWMSALRLLQDDDKRVRAKARHAVLYALLNATEKPAFHVDSSQSDASILPVAINFIASLFVKTKDGAKNLSNVLMKLIDANSVLQAYTGAAGAKALDWNDLYRRIFESESNNYFAEQDVVAQNWIIALLIRAGSESERIQSLHALILTAVECVLTTLIHDAQACLDKKNQWLGGILYFPNVFARLFGLLAAAVAILTSSLHQLSTELFSLANKVRELAREALQFYGKDDGMHPFLIRALELLASNQENGLTTQGAEPVRDLLYLTPDWAA